MATKSKRQGPGSFKYITLAAARQHLIAGTHVMAIDQAYDHKEDCLYHPIESVHPDVAQYGVTRGTFDALMTEWAKEDLFQAVFFQPLWSSKPRWSLADSTLVETASACVKQPKAKDTIHDPRTSVTYYLNKKPTLQEVRKLRVGDVLDAYFKDDFDSQRVIVTGDVGRGANHWDIRVMSENGSRSMLNTDRWTKVGTLDWSKLQHALK